MNWFLLASCSALLSAGAAVLQKKILFRLSAIEFSFLVSLSILACSLFIPFAADVTAITPQVLAILVVKSILGGAAFLFVMISLERNQISTALPLLGLTPAVTAVVSLLVLGESLRSTEWTGMGLLILGIYMLERRPAQRLIQPFREAVAARNHWSIFAALGLFAISSVMDKLLVSPLKTNPIIVLFYQHIVYCVMFGLVVWARRVPLRSLAGRGWEQLAAIGIVAVLTIVYRFTQLEATKLAPVALVLAVKRTSILYASFIGGRIYSEDRLATKFVGGALIVAAGFFILRNVA